MIYAITFSLGQALQFVIIAPCILVILYLLLVPKNKAGTILPIVYFAILALSCLHNLTGAVSDHLNYNWLNFISVFSDILIPSFSFMLILLFLFNRNPPLLYWLALLAPVVSCGPFVYASIYIENICILNNICVNTHQMLTLNNIIISSLLFMMLVFIIERQFSTIESRKTLSRYKYWIIISMIIFNLFILAIDLVFIRGLISLQSHIFAITMFKIAFVYMVLSSIFRVFESILTGKTAYYELNNEEMSIATSIEKLFTETKPFTDVNFNRKKFSKIVGITEHKLSHIVNLHFNKSCSELINDYRMAEAKLLLETSERSVTDIAFDSGFGSITTFNRVFKEYSGLSPSDYRKKYKK